LAPPNKLIETAWKNYVRLSLDPVGANAVQRRETKIAFYLGALALFEGIISDLTSGEEVNEGDLNMMDSVQRELTQFTENLKAGRNP
jgi:molybdopterin synthase catalytic subunit